jgi:hypothetical protein
MVGPHMITYRQKPFQGVIRELRELTLILTSLRQRPLQSRLC